MGSWKSSVVCNCRLLLNSTFSFLGNIANLMSRCLSSLTMCLLTHLPTQNLLFRLYSNVWNLPLPSFFSMYLFLQKGLIAYGLKRFRSEERKQNVCWLDVKWSRIIWIFIITYCTPTLLPIHNESCRIHNVMGVELPIQLPIIYSHSIYPILLAILFSTLFIHADSWEEATRLECDWS